MNGAIAVLPRAISTLRNIRNIMIGRSHHGDGDDTGGGVVGTGKYRLPASLAD